MSIQRVCLSLAAIVLLASCASVAAPPRAQTAAAWSQWETPQAAGYDPAKLDQARAAADRARSAAVMIIDGGHVVSAWGDVSRKLELHSVRKSLYAAMYGAAVERGLIDLDATLAELGVDDLTPLTPREKQAKLRDLLYARSGVYHPAAYAPAGQERNRPARDSKAPGTHWYYNNWDFNVAGALLERAAKKPLGEAFEEWIASPIGMEDFTPADVARVDEPRTSRWPALTFRMSTRDLARFGALWAARGRWNGRQVLPAEWVELASKPLSELEPKGTGYAMMWWTHAPGSLSAEQYPHASRHRVVRASGTGGQAIAVFPELDLVIVHRGDTDHGLEVDGRTVWSLVDKILAARIGQPRPDARLVALQPIPLSSQLPPFQFPATVPLSEREREALVGRYQFTPTIVAEVYEHEDRLFASIPGVGTAELFAKSPQEFFVRVDPTAEVRFDGDTVFVRIEGRAMTGKRLAS